MVQIYLTAAEVTESTVKDCVEVGLKGSIQLSKLGDIEGHIKPVDKCDTITNKPTGVYVYTIFLIVRY